MLARPNPILAPPARPLTRPPPTRPPPPNPSQVCSHIKPFARAAGVRVAAIVGGLATAKQARLLAARPALVVATPGRLWDLMDGGDAHLANLTGLTALVLDEADRMVQTGHFKEVANILGRVEGARCTGAGMVGGGEATAQQEGSDNDSDSGDEEGKEDGGSDAEDEGGSDDEGGDAASEDGDNDDASPSDGDDTAAAPAPIASSHPSRPFLQTFVFSATLTLPSQQRRRVKKGGGGGGGGASLDALMDAVPLRPKPAVVDLTAAAATLADGVVEAVVRCADDAARDAALYHVLAAHAGRALVFVNSVAAGRRLAGWGGAALPAYIRRPVRPRCYTLDDHVIPQEPKKVTSRQPHSDLPLLISPPSPSGSSVRARRSKKQHQ